MAEPTLETLRRIQDAVKNAMDQNTLTTVEGEEIVEEPIDGELHKRLRDVWKYVFERIRRLYPDAVDHKVRRV